VGWVPLEKKQLKKRKGRGRHRVELKADLFNLNILYLSCCHSFTPQQNRISLGSAKDKELVYSGSFSPSYE
jgi:hypothetical protein